MATFRHGVAVLMRWPYREGIVGLGHVLPALLLLAALALPGWAMALTPLAGVAMVAGGLLAKYALILKAAFLVDLYDGFGRRPAAAGAPHPRPAPSAAAA